VLSFLLASAAARRASLRRQPSVDDDRRRCHFAVGGGAANGEGDISPLATVLPTAKVTFRRWRRCRQTDGSLSTWPLAARAGHALYVGRHYVGCDIGASATVATPRNLKSSSTRETAQQNQETRPKRKGPLGSLRSTTWSRTSRKRPGSPGEKSPTKSIRNSMAAAQCEHHMQSTDTSSTMASN